VKLAPRPAARLLLAGRFLVPRAALLALPDGPVAGLDLASGELVGLAFGPSADDAEALVARVERWNGLHLPACTAIRDLHWHLGRPLVAFALPPYTPGGAPLDDASSHDVARSAALGDVLAGAGLGLPVGPADLALGPGGPLLRRPAIWPHDPDRPLSDVLAKAASRLIGRVPLRDVPPARTEQGSLRAELARRLPASRRTRLALVAACGVLSAILVSGLSRPAHQSSLPRAEPLRAALAAPAAAAPARPRRVALHAPVLRSSSRGGPARVLQLARPATPAPRRDVPARSSTAPRVVATPTRGWVDGLFVGS
jgi:hypothetical protein